MRRLRLWLKRLAIFGLLIALTAGVALFFVLRSNFKTSVLIVHDHKNYLFRLRKDVSFLNKPALKNKLEDVPPDSFVLIDATRADFIDKDIVEVIEDFMIHAPLKNIRVELKSSRYKRQGFAITPLPHTGTNGTFEQRHKKTPKTEEA